MQYEGTMDSVLFETWYTNHLLPCLSKGTVIVMDNASFHRKSKLYGLSEQYGMNLMFLPPYSPDLNPIENFWNQLKCYLKKVLSFHSSFNSALSSFFQVG